MTPTPPPKKKSPQNLNTPKIFIFLKTPKDIKIQSFEPPKITRAYVYMKISEKPPANIIISSTFDEVSHAIK